MEGLNMEGARYVCSPPPRDEKSQQECWAGLQQHVFSLFSSDHCPFRYDDAQGKLNPKGRTSFRWVPNGIPGVETRLPILFSEGVKKGRISVTSPIARALIAQRLQSGKGLLFSIVGASGFLPEGIRVLTVKPRESRRPAIAHFMIAENEPLGLNLGGCRHSGGEKRSDESAHE